MNNTPNSIANRSVNMQKSLAEMVQIRRKTIKDEYLLVREMFHFQRFTSSNGEELMSG